MEGDFERSAREDPLFAAEGMDLENGRAALDVLEKDLSRLEAAFAADAFRIRLFFMRYPLARYAVPLSFLRSFIAAEEARRSYLAHPNDKRARVLLNAWRNAAYEYAKSVKRYREFHRILVKLEPQREHFVLQDLFGNTSSLDHIEHTLTLLEQNAAALLAEVRQRRSSAPKQNRFRSHNLPRATASTIAAEDQYLHDLEVQGGATPFRQATVEEVHGPIRYSVAPIDGKATPHTFLFYLLRHKATNVRSMWPAYVDTYLFTHVWNRPKDEGGTVGKTNFVYGGGHSAEEMPYWYHASAHLYSSRDIQYWFDLATMIDLERRPQLDRAAVLSQRSSLFDRALGAAAIDLNLYVRHTLRRSRAHTLSSYSHLYGLLMRSHPGLFYLPFNASIWRIEDDLHLMGDGRALDALTHYRPKSLVLSELKPDVLARVMGAQKVREERERAEGWWT